MATSVQTKDEGFESVTEDRDRVEQVREHVCAAAQILKSLGPQQERIAWLLEDALVYLDETETEAGSFDFEAPC